MADAVTTTTVIDGFSIRNGNSSDSFGGSGIYANFANPIIQNCTFEGSNEYALLINRGGPIISNCEFINNLGGLHCYNTYNTLVNNNNFFSNTEYIFKLSYRSGGSLVNAEENWWDTVIESEIQELIYDENDEPGGNDIGIVNYSEWKMSKINNIGPQP